MKEKPGDPRLFLFLLEADSESHRNELCSHVVSEDMMVPGFDERVESAERE